MVAQCKSSSKFSRPVSNIMTPKQLKTISIGYGSLINFSSNPFYSLFKFPAPKLCYLECLDRNGYRAERERIQEVIFIWWEQQTQQNKAELVQRRWQAGWAFGQRDHGSKGHKYKMSKHSSSSCFLTKVTLKSIEPRINKSKTGTIPPHRVGRGFNCVSMCMHIQRIKVILSTLTENYISGFRHVLCYALKLKSEKCSLNDPKALENTSAIQEKNTIHLIQRSVGKRYDLHPIG